MSVKSKLLATLKSWAEREDAPPQMPPVPGRPSSPRDRDDDGGLAHFNTIKGGDVSSQ